MRVQRRLSDTSVLQTSDVVLQCDALWRIEVLLHHHHLRDLLLLLGTQSAVVHVILTVRQRHGRSWAFRPFFPFRLDGALVVLNFVTQDSQDMKTINSFAFCVCDRFRMWTLK